MDRPDGVVTAPAALAAAPRRATAVLAVPAPLGLMGGRAWRDRLVTAARQDLWRALRGRRGLAPVAAALDAPPRLIVAVAALDGAAASPALLAALRQILHHGVPERWTRYADGAETAARGACSRRS